MVHLRKKKRKAPSLVQLFVIVSPKALQRPELTLGGVSEKLKKAL